MRRSPIMAWGTCVLLMAMAGQPPAAGQEAADPVVDALHTRVGQFLQSIALNTPQAAYQELLAGSVLLKQTEGLNALVEQTGKLKDRCGEYRAYERILAKHVGNDVVILVYLYKGETLPVVWRFVFYRTPPPGEGAAEGNNNPWQVISLRFHTELERAEE